MPKASVPRGTRCDFILHDGSGGLKHCPNKATAAVRVPPFPWETYVCDDHNPSASGGANETD